jgi:hypothetical protein
MGDVNQSAQIDKIKECFNNFKQKMSGIIPQNNDKETIRNLQDQIKIMQQ